MCTTQVKESHKESPFRITYKRPLCSTPREPTFTNLSLNLRKSGKKYGEVFRIEMDRVYLQRSAIEKDKLFRSLSLLFLYSVLFMVLMHMMTSQHRTDLRLRKRPPHGDRRD